MSNQITTEEEKSVAIFQEKVKLIRKELDSLDLYTAKQILEKVKDGLEHYAFISSIES